MTRFGELARLGCVFLGAILVSGCDQVQNAFDPNSKPTYGNTGLPKNCRAIVGANIEGWRSKQYTAEEALNSINRNCGINGYSWRQ